MEGFIIGNNKNSTCDVFIEKQQPRNVDNYNIIVSCLLSDSHIYNNGHVG